MSEPVSGGLVPGYELGAAIGKGGFATVHRARQVSLDRDVAVKIDTRVLDDPRNRRRFLRESTASALISSHPHVVSLIDAGTTRDNRPYLVMELCENGSVGQLVKRSGPLPAPDVLELGIAIASALAAAHERGILHRDIKPSNILLDAYGTPRLGDFGLAALPAHGDASVTLEALTPAYAAPEAFEQAEPSKRADVWALGATLYSLLTGATPRQREDGSPQTVAEIVSTLYRPLPPASGVQGADALLGVVRRATSPHPDQRFADGADLHAALLELRGTLGRGHNVLAGAEVTRMTPGLQRQSFPSAGAPSVPQPPRGLDGPTTPRRAWPLVLGALVAVAVGVGGYALTTALLNASGNPADLPPASGEGVSPRPSTPARRSPEPSSSWTGGPGIVEPASPVCFAGLTSIGGFYTARTLDCDTEHAWEAFMVGSLSEETLSANIDDVEADPVVQQACTPEALASYTGTAADWMEIRVLPPSEAAFEGGSRLFYCVASGGAATGSFRAP